MKKYIDLHGPITAAEAEAEPERDRLFSQPARPLSHELAALLAKINQQRRTTMGNPIGPSASEKLAWSLHDCLDQLRASKGEAAATEAARRALEVVSAAQSRRPVHADGVQPRPARRPAARS